MRFAYAAIIALGLATPAMAQQVIVQGPHPGVAAVDQNAARNARVDQSVNTRDARVDQNIARRDAAHGNYVGAAHAQQDARINANDARRDSAVANRDHRAAVNQDSTHITIRQ